MYEMIEKLFVNNLKKLRQKAGLTQSDTAHSAGISIRYYQRIESGESWPPPDTIKGLAKALKIPEFELFYNEKADSIKNDKSSILASIVIALTTLDERELKATLDLISNFPSSRSRNRDSDAG